MKLNLKYYNGKDEYSDGDVEDRIIELIKKYPNDLEEALTEDSSWPVFYHLSDARKNSVRWYPFKKNSSILEVGGGMGAITDELCRKCAKVTTIELSKRRSTAILERNKNAKNLEILVGNFKDIKLDEKYDYILLNGVLEYGALYIDSDNPYEDFINKLKKNLKPDGKILIAIENRFGLKYLCGANEDHTGIPFDGLNDYPNSTGIRTFSKTELEVLADKCNLNINFYYMFPDYKFPEIIYTDKSLETKTFVNYWPYYSSEMYLHFKESKFYKDLFDAQCLPFFANSFFLELSVQKEQQKIEFVKFNSFRIPKYRLLTYCMDNNYYKKEYSKDSLKFLKDYKGSSKILSDQGFKTIEICEDNNGIFTKSIKCKSFLDTIIEEYKNDNLESLEKNFGIYKDFVYEHYKNQFTQFKNDIFDKYNIKISAEKKKKLHFVKRGYIDIIPQNMLLVDNDFYLIDQEWYMDNVPYEFIIYRGIVNSIRYCEENKLDEYLKMMGIYEFFDEFAKLENCFQDGVLSIFFRSMNGYIRNSDNVESPYKKVDYLIKENERLISENKHITESKIHFESEYNAIINSKRWKYLNKILKIFRK